MAGQFDTGKITKSRPLYEQVYQRLRKVIIEGGISSGASLTESSLSKQLGVSRTPVREALRQLQQEGLVVLDDKGRFRVPEPDPEDLIHLYEARILLECWVARRAAERVLPEQLEEMAKALAVADYSREMSDPSGVLEYNSRFHDIIAEAAGNPRVKELLSTVRTHISYMRAMISRQTTLAAGIAQEHYEILEAFRNKDTEKVVQQVENHLRNDLRRILDAQMRLEQHT